MYVIYIILYDVYIFLYLQVVTKLQMIYRLSVLALPCLRATLLQEFPWQRFFYDIDKMIGGHRVTRDKIHNSCDVLLSVPFSNRVQCRSIFYADEGMRTHRKTNGSMFFPNW